MTDTIRRIDFLLREQEEDNPLNEPLFIPSPLKKDKRFSYSYIKKVYAKVKDYPMNKLRKNWLTFAEEVRNQDKEKEVLYLLNQTFKTHFTDLDKFAKLEISDEKPLEEMDHSDLEVINLALRLSFPLGLILGSSLGVMVWPAVIFIGMLHVYHTVGKGIPDVLERLETVTKRIFSKEKGNERGEFGERDYRRSLGRRDYGERPKSSGYMRHMMPPID